MKKGWFSSAVACVGAVIGAGFASGREIVTFFTRYGVHSWWLIVLTALSMTGLCALCMRSAARSECSECWCGLIEFGHPALQTGMKIGTLLLLTITGGAMIAAAGHMVALLCAAKHAYSMGAALTLILAWMIGFGSMRPMSWLSGVLMSLLLILLLCAAGSNNKSSVVHLQDAPSGSLAMAALCAVAYAAMNLTLAIGVVCCCAVRSENNTLRTSLCFGMIMTGLLLLSNVVYGRQQHYLNDAFPVVRLLSGVGRAGYQLSAVLMYLSVLTTLTAVLYAMRTSMERFVNAPWLSTAITLGLPVCLSAVGFTGIVDTLYAPAGLLCLALVFAPMAYGYFGRRQTGT